MGLNRAIQRTMWRRALELGPASLLESTSRPGCVARGVVCLGPGANLIPVPALTLPYGEIRMLLAGGPLLGVDNIVQGLKPEISDSVAAPC